MKRMKISERVTRIWVTRFMVFISMVVALFVLAFSLFSNHSSKVYGLSTEVTTESELLTALSSSEYDEIIVRNSITLSNGTVLDGDQDDDGQKKTIRASVTGTSDQGVVNSNASNYTLFYVATGATVHINNCIIKGGGSTAIVNGTSTNTTTNNSTLYIENCQIANSGSSNNPGGGIRNTVGCKVVLKDSSIFRNVAKYGAGFQNQQGTFIMDNCSVSENRSLGVGYGGGGGENTGNEGRNESNAYMYIYNSTIANNTSGEIGGGINNCKQGYLYIVNSTIAGNATNNKDPEASGGGVGNNKSTLVCTNCILLDNVYISSTETQEQDAYLFDSGSVTLDGCVYGEVSGQNQTLANSINVESTCYQVSESDSVFAATKTGSLIDSDGSQGPTTYNQVVLVEDENGVPHAPIASDSKAIASNSSLSPVKVEFDYSDLSNIILKTGNECSSETVAPTSIGSSEAIEETEKIATVTVFVNKDFEINGGTVYGDSYIINTEEKSSITLSAQSATGNENVSVAWALVDQEHNTLEIVSGNNPYRINTSLNSTVMQHSWDASKNAYDIVLQPLTLSLNATAADSSVTLNWSLDWSNTYCKDYSLSNAATGFDIYYGLVNDFNSPSTTKFTSVSGDVTTATVTGLENETTYYFFVLPQGDEEIVDDDIVGYVSATPMESGAKTYVLVDSLEAGEEYLIVSSDAVGTARALTKVTGNYYGTTTSVTVSTDSFGTPFIKTAASNTMLWTATKNNNNYWRFAADSYSINLSRNNRIIYTSGANQTVTFTGSKASIKYYNGNYYLSLANSTPSRANSAQYVYFYKLKTKPDAPTTVTASMQTIVGQDSGNITGISTAMEYSTNGVDWVECTGTQMTGVPVGKYFFRFKETSLTYASAPVTVEVLPKKITNISIKTSPKLNYTAKDLLDLSSMVVTIVYNDDTTIDVPFADFSSQDYSVYQRENGTLTVSMENGTVLECSNNNSKVTVSLDGFSTTTLALTINHKLSSVPFKAATCEEDGNQAYYVCESCGKVYDSNNNESSISALTIEALGHSYGTATYTWSSDYSTCTAEVVCSHDSTHVIRETVSTTSSITMPSTCEAKGQKTYQANFVDSHFTTQTATSEIPALGHDFDYENGNWTWHNNYYVTVVFTCKNDSSHTESYTANMSNAITLDPTCEEEGIRTYTATVTIDGVDYIDTKTESIAALGHNYLSPAYEWSSDCSTCTATRVCQRDSSHKITEIVQTTSSVTQAPTCTMTGVETYTAVFTNTIDFTTQTTTRTIPALGHDYDYENGEWNWDSIYYVTLTFTCKNDSSHKETIQATITSKITLAPTCEEEGINTYTATVTRNGKTYTDTYLVSIDPTGHVYGTPTFTWSSDYSTCTAKVVCNHDSTHIIEETVNSISSIDVEATCEDAGRGLFTAKFTNTTYFYDQTVYTVIPALGHDYVVSYVWNGTSSVTATAICNHDSTHVIEETVNTTSVTIDPTCEDLGLITYTAEFVNDLFELQTKEVEIPSLGHSYGEVTYTWSSDNTSVTASRECERCNHVDEETSVTTSVTVDPTCEDEGKVTYTATFTNTAFETQTKEVSIPALGHQEGEIVIENEVDPTCETLGSYDEVIYCTICNKELSREPKEVAALGHSYGNVTYTWSDDYTSVTATRECERCNHVDEEISVTTSATIDPTCEDEGKVTYTAAFINDVFETQTKTVDISPLGHFYGNVTYTWSSDNASVTASRECERCNHVDEEISVTTSVTVDPTCEGEGSTTYTATFTNTAFETQTKEVSISPLGHIEGEVVIENEVAPTCEDLGSYDEVIYCTICNKELSREPKEVAALGHSYGNVTYTWSDDYTSVTATRECERCNHVDEEISVTTSATIDPTCEDEGKVTYTAAFINDVFETQTKEISIPAPGHQAGEAVIENEVDPTCEELGSYDEVIYCTICNKELSREPKEVAALGHSYGNVTYTWTSDNTSVTASRECDRCNHVDEKIATTTSITIDPTCEGEGKVTYTAVFTNAAFETQTKTVDISPLGHSYGEVTYTWSNDNSTVTASRECDRCNHVDEKIATTTSITVNPTCEDEGLTTYTAVFTDTVFETQTKTVDISPLGHSYGNVTYTWSSDNSKVTASRECDRCNHVDEEIATTTSVTVDPTCEDEGSTTYTATFTNTAFETQTKEVSIAPAGHIEGEVVIENEVAPTCEDLGSYDEVIYCTICNKELSREPKEVAALGHSYGNVTYTWSDDYTSVTATRVCIHDSTHIETETVSTSYKTKTPATCTKTGILTYTAIFTNSAFETQTKDKEISALGHKAGVSVTENHVDPTCENSGSYDVVVYCQVCDFELSRQTIEIPALGHTYGEVTYTWSNDNSTVTASRECDRCNHVDEEIATTTSITVNPTCEDEGLTTYTAVFKNTVFETQTKTVDISPLGHSYGNVTYVWSEDNKSVTATRVCVHDSTHIETETVQTTSVTVSPTCEVEGLITYTAVFTNSAFEMKTKEVAIPSLGHSYGEVTYVWSSDNGSVTASRECLSCGDVEEETVETTKDVVDATCTLSGLTTYTATFTNKAFQKQIKEIEISPLGHDYANPTYEWSIDNKNVLATIVCSHDSNHVITESVMTTSEITKAPTCDTEGIRVFSAVFTSPYFSNQTKNVEIEALGHNYTHFEEVSATCEKEGIMEYYFCENCKKYYNSSYEEVSYDDLILPQLGHDFQYANGVWTWSSDYSSATYKVTCSHDLAHTLTYNAEVTSMITLEAACTSSGIKTYTAKVEINGVTYTQNKTETINALGHEYDYENGIWTWNEDYSSATISFVCSHDSSHMDSYNALVSSEITISPSCTALGLRTYTAKVSLDGKVYMDTKTKEIDMIPHAYNSYDEVLPTCEEDGLALHYICSICGEYFDSNYNKVSYKDLILEALGHSYDYSNGTWTWSNDYQSAVYKVSCIHDATHTISYNAVVESTIVSYATHIATGLKRYTATVTILGIEYKDTKDEELPKLHHENSIIIPAADPTCENDGNILYYHCVECGKYFSDSLMTIEILIEDTVILALGHTYIYHEEVLPNCTNTGMEAHYTCSICNEVFDLNKNKVEEESLVILALGHVLSDPIRENEVAPTCEASGSYDSVIYCMVCHEEISRQQVEVKALGHDYIYHEEVLPTCTNTGMEAYYTCSRCDKIFDSNKEQTSLDDLVILALGHTYIYHEKVLPTCTNTGMEAHYTCSLCNEIFDLNKNIVEENSLIIASLGHTLGDVVIENEVDPTCDTIGSYDEVIYCMVCHKELSRETKEINALGHTLGDVVIENEVDPTCDTIGSYDEVIYCIVCHKELSRETKEINALGHKLGDIVIENEVDPTCDTKGSYDEVIYCTVCHKELSRETKEVAALGHTYSDVTYTWLENYSKASASRVCLICNHVDEEIISSTTTTIAATCISDGSVKYVASFTNDAFKSQTHTEIILALGHEYQITYTWSTDNKTVTATAICTHDSSHKIIETITTTSVIENPSCELDGKITYIAEFTNSTFENQLKEVIISALGHSYGEPQVENEVEPTCTQDGSYDLVIYCTVCGIELDRETVEVARLGHKEREAVMENVVSATCTQDGSYDLVTYCSLCGIELDRESKTISKIDHQYIHHDAVAPTCITSGEYEYYSCSICDKYFDTDYNEVSYSTIYIPALGHTASLAVRENEIDATCELPGSYDLVVYCMVCHEEISRDVINTVALGHSYTDASYTWAQDYSYIIARKECSLCGNSIEEEIIPTSVTIDATCEAAGKIIYTAEFNDESFETQKVEVIISALGHSYKSTLVSPTCENEGYTIHICERCGETYKDNYRDALGHDYDSYSWTWSSDYSLATITFVCSKDNSHKETIEGIITITNELPSCEEDGLTTYTAVVTFEGKVYKDVKSEVINALGHIAGEKKIENEVTPTCEVNGSYDEVVYCTVCGKELIRNSIEVPAINHLYDYSNGTWTWSNDYSEASYIVTCKHDSSHKITNTATVESVILTPASHLDSGLKKYTATVTVDGLVFQDERMEVLPKLHHENSIIISMKNPTCEEDGNILYYHCLECDKYFSDSSMTIEISLNDTIISALGHDYIYIDEAPATCINEGVMAHYVCQNCNKVFDLNKNETTLEALKIEALGHEYHSVITNPTCEDKGYTTYTCERCNDTYVSDYQDALGHEYKITYEWNNDFKQMIAKAICLRCNDTITEEANSTVIEKEATCESDGYIKYIVEFTNALFATQEKEIEFTALEHIMGEAVVENLVSSTCESEGSYDSVIYCTICHKELFRETKTVSKIDHSYTKTLTNPTCEDEGYTTYTCERCGYSYVSDYIDALGHEYHSVITNPTCEDKGYTTYTCERCNDSYVSDYIDALGHDYKITYTWNGNSSVLAKAICMHDMNHVIEELVTTSSTTVNATCQSRGLKTYVAKFNNPLFEEQTKEIILDQLDHTYIYHAEVLPSCEDSGLEAHYICSYCNEVFDSNKNETTLEALKIDALGHEYHGVVTNPTCENQGYTTYTCERCNDSYVSDYIDALGHEYHSVITNPTCEDQGYTTYTCERCNDTYVSDYQDALGHNYSNPTYTWSDDNSYVSARTICTICSKEIVEDATTTYILISEATCLNDGSEKYIVAFMNDLFDFQEKVISIPALGHDLVHHDGLNPTCTEFGYDEYDTCTRCDYSTYKEKSALGHKPNDAIVENEIIATCETNGSYDEVIYCKECGNKISSKTIVVYALGHSYSSKGTQPTCEMEGYTTHTCSRCGDSYIDNYTNALGHSYGEALYTWSNDNSLVTASKICLRCGEEVIEVSTTKTTVLKKASCQEEGILVYTAVFNDFETETKMVSIAKLDHNPKDSVIENEILATCLESGSYDVVIYCSECNKELFRESIETKALGHDYDYDNGIWSWNNYSEATYICFCKNDNSHKIVNSATVTVETIKEATDLETGIRLYKAYVLVDGHEYESQKEEVIPTTNHTITITYRLEPTCEAKGNITYYYCSSCNMYYSDAELLHEISYEDTIIEALGHDYISHSGKAPTCTEAGFDSYQTCSRCNYSTYTSEILALGHNFEETIVPATCEMSGYTLHSCTRCNESYKDSYEDALGHNYKITYTWSSDDSTVTAKAICTHDSSHVILEEVNSKSSTLVLVGCETDGQIKFTATFMNGLFDLQTKIVVVEKTGHNEGEMRIENSIAPTCLQAGSHDEVYYCTICGEVIRRKTKVEDAALGHDFVYHDGLNPTCEEVGYKPYAVCMRCDYSTYEEINALGHNDIKVKDIIIEEATCLATGAHYEVTYCSVCDKELSKTIVIDSKLGHNYQETVIESTCTTQGYKVHTCQRCGYSYVDTYIDALGHDYSMISYVWNSDNSYVDAYAYCSHDHKHVIYEGAYTSHKVTKDATCEEEGIKLYSVSFTNILFANQTKDVAISPLGHTYSDASYEWNEYNSFVTATRECIICNHIDKEIASTASVILPETCEEDGLITYTVTFDNEAFKMQQKEVIIDASGHKYGDASYTWSDDYKYCTARRVCIHDNSHIEEEVSSSTNKIVLSTCTMKGSITYTVSFENNAFDTIVKVIELDALGHTNGAPVEENRVYETCVENGSYDSVIYCSVCGDELERNQVTVPMLGHNYSTPTYTWDMDYLHVTAIRVCQNDSCHIEEEVVETTNKTKLSPTCDQKGIVTYTAKFTNSAFANQSLDVYVNALGHRYGSWYLEETPFIDSEGSICRVCRNDSSHVERISIPELNDTDYEYSIITKATGATDGLGEYYKVFNGVEVRVNVKIPAYGFTYSYYKNNILIAQYHGYDGESLIVPNDLESYVVNGYVYYFNGWDKEIPLELHEDMKFFAKFIIAQVIYHDAIIEIPDSLTIDPSYRIEVDKDTTIDSLEDKSKVLTSVDSYSDFEISNIFDVRFEKDGKKVELDDGETIRIKIKADSIKDLDEDTKLFYFDENGEVREISYYSQGDYIVFEIGNVGTIGFANDGFNWLWAVFVIQSMSIVLLVVVIIYRKKMKA